MNDQSDFTNLPPNQNQPPTLPQPILDIESQLDERGEFKPSSADPTTQPINPPTQEAVPDQPPVQPQMQPTPAANATDASPQMPGQQPASPQVPPTYTQTSPVTTESTYADQFLDRLNTLDMKPKKKMPKLTKPLLILIGLGGVATLVILAVALFSRPAQVSITDLSTALLARVKAANELSSQYYSKIRNSGLRSANANMQQALSGMTHDMTGYSTELVNKAAALAAKEAKEKPKVVTKINVKAEPTNDIIKRLDEAVLTATLDKAYQKEIIFIVDQTLLLMNRLDKQTTDPKLKEIIKTNRENIKISRDELEAVNLYYD